MKETLLLQQGRFWGWWGAVGCPRFQLGIQHKI